MRVNMNNPCMTCEVGQRCCRQLSGLKLTAREFEENFKKYAADLSILLYKKIYIVSSMKNNTCPHWAEKGCTIYHERSIDCRLFPYTVTRVLEKRNSVIIEFHDETDCPHRHDLFLPMEEAKALMTNFGQEVYGADKPVIIRYSPPRKGISRCLNLFDPLISRLSKIIRSYHPKQNADL
jgi:Fe-S-cluster containining protein